MQAYKIELTVKNDANISIGDSHPNYQSLNTLTLQ